MEEIFEELGLTVLEIKIFKFLLDNGPSIVGDIARKTGIHRRNSYDALERLIQKGLVNYIKSNNVKYYEPSSPNIVLDKLKARVKEWEELVPEIEKKQQLWGEKKETLFFRGMSGLKNIFFDQIEVCEEVLMFGATKDASSVVKYFFPRYHLLRKENKIKIRMLLDTEAKNTPVKGIVSKLPFHKTKYIENFNSTNVAKYVYGNNVAIITWDEEPYGILIRNGEMAQSFRDEFELLWGLK